MIQRARALAQAQFLEAEQIVPQEIKKKQMQIDAEAEAVLSIRQAEAEGIQKLC